MNRSALYQGMPFMNRFALYQGTPFRRAERGVESVRASAPAKPDALACPERGRKVP
jgi:hypothetical protein